MFSNSRALDHMPSIRVTIRGVSLDKSGYQGCVFDGNFVQEIKYLLETYRVDGETILPLEDGIYYGFNVLEVKKQDTLQSDYVPDRRAPTANFTLPPSHCIRYVEREWSLWTPLTRSTKLYSPHWKRPLPPRHSESSRKPECLFGHYFQTRERRKIETQEDFPSRQARFQYSVFFGRGEADSGDLCEWRGLN